MILNNIIHNLKNVFNNFIKKMAGLATMMEWDVRLGRYTATPQYITQTLSFKLNEVLNFIVV
jgi:hypothetical protein